ncbi:MAG: transcription termination factor NusA [Spirochaetaceae bacterium]|nr:transcription termination factor NusA [Spirochaetaceae bacterium]
MAKDISDAVRALREERNLSDELIYKAVQDTLISAYKKKFDKKEKPADNGVVRIDDNMVTMYAQKTIVDEVDDPVFEISLEEAQGFDPEAEEGDELLIEINPESFERAAVQSAKFTARNDFRDLTKDSLYAEFKDKEGEIIIGYYQRERNGNIYVDLGKVEGILPKKYQSPRESYKVNDRIKALIVSVEKQGSLQIVLSRTHTDFVRAIFELEVPEIYDKTVEIHKIVREAGYRTKLAVYSNREDVDPVGACVGLKGVRIQAVIRELEGEKIDVFKYEIDPRRFIKNALSPAEVKEVIILDETKRHALAVVQDSQLSLAIGKQGLNVRLANRLCDWNIDVKTEAQFQEMDIASESRRQVSELFGDMGDEISRISELPGVDLELAVSLQDAGIDYIEDYLAAGEEELLKINGVSEKSLDILQKLIEEYVEIVEDEEELAEEEREEEEDDEIMEEAEAEADEEEDEEEEVFECPECGAPITLDMTHCPNCGVELSFEFEDGE